MSLLPPPVASFDEQLRALREGAGARVLEGLAVLRVSGADRAKWLNGLVTHDTRALAPGRSTYAAAVAVKGKILTDLFVFARADALLLALPASRVEELLAHFDRFIVMEDVTLERLDATLVSVQGPGAAPPAAGEGYPADRLGRGGYDVLVAPADADAVRESLREVTVVSAEAWEAARIEAAVPAFEVDFDTTHYVQEAAITPRAVSFNKGCYLGQEVVCRLEMRGHVQRLLVGLSLPGDAPAKGAAVTADGQDVGVVTSAARVGDGSVALAMVKLKAVEGGAPLAVAGVAATLRRAHGA